MAPPAGQALTLVLTLKDRSAFTYRWLRYMNDAQCPYLILIADGGADPAIETHLRQPALYPNLRYTYLRYPFDRDYPAYYRKLADALDRVTTPYVLMADNDDFFFLDPIPSFIDCLNRDDSLVSCGGRQVNLRVLATNGEMLAAPSAADYRATVVEDLKPVTDPHPVDRICTFLALRPWSAWYHVHRTAAIQAATRAVHDHEFRDPCSFEIHVHLWLLTAGKSMHVDALWYVRQYGSSQLTSALVQEGNVMERFTSSNAFADLHRSVESLSALSASDRHRVYRALTRWIASEAHKGHPGAVKNTVTGPEDVVERLYRWTRRLVRPLASAFRSRPVVPTTRLPSLEPFIVDSGRNGLP